MGYDNKQVLFDIDFTFEAGKIYGLLGRNGAGKTTLFNTYCARIPDRQRVFEILYD